jgi:dipeptidase D
MYPFQGLKPEKLWHFFYEICQIPRPSKKEGKMIDYLTAFSAQYKLDMRKDAVGNIVISKPATPGMENHKTVALQSHVDMVCEKNRGVEHDFDKDPIQPYIDDKGWVRAKGTTLGADNGIGVAAAMAVLASDDITHGPIECLFTIDEETGLTGALALQPGFLTAKVLLNLDSEDEGEFTIGCAGGKDTTITLPVQTEATPAGMQGFEVEVTGLRGGHSGVDIHLGLGNANKIMARLLWNGAHLLGLRVHQFSGGNLRNAIAREAFASVAVPTDKKSEFEQFAASFNEIVREELKTREPGLKVTVKEVAAPATVLDSGLQFRLLNSLNACPHGVMAMSADVPGLVETSTNLSSVKMSDDLITVGTSQRSSLESSKINVHEMVASTFRLAGGQVTSNNGYPGWKPNVQSEVLEVMKTAYQDLFGKPAHVLAIHAGLECGIIGEKNPGMDMISFGPTIKGAHSPDECIDCASTEKFWDLLVDVLKRI